MFITDKSPQEIIEHCFGFFPDLKPFFNRANNLAPVYKGSMQPYQAAFISWLVHNNYNYRNAKILEIGTGVGYSTAFLANACPLAKIYTINPNSSELEFAAKYHQNLELGNITYINKSSDEYFGTGNKHFDMIFVDGDHKNIRSDLKWWNTLHSSGLMLFHDYTDETGSKPQIHVWNELNKFCMELKRTDFDVLVIDTKDKYGMCGFYHG